MIRVMIAEDQGLVRGALAALLELEEDITVVCQAADGEEAVEMATMHQPDVALVDIELPKKSGLEVVDSITKLVPTCNVLMVTTFARPGYLQRAVKSGAKGYLLKEAKLEDLTDAVRTLYAGGTVMSQELLLSAWQMENPLTKRELEVLRLAADGLTTRELATSLFLSEGTIRNYLSEIISKLQVQTRTEAVKVAETNGWL